MKPVTRLGLPITARVLILTLVALVIAQLVTIVAVLAAPPLPPPQYTLSEIVAALRGDSIDTTRRRPVTRRLSASLPDTILKRPNDVTTAAQLARVLKVPPDDVRFVRRGPPDLVLATSIASPRQGAPPRRPPDDAPDGHDFVGNGSGGPPRPPPDEFGDVGPVKAGMPGPPPGLYNYRPADPPHGRGDPDNAGLDSAQNAPSGGTIDEFTAALRNPDGTWIVVEPSPEWEWLRRIAIWLIGGTIIVVPLAWVVAHHIARPIRRFAAAAERLGHDPDAPDVPIDGPAEIGMAAMAFNDMQIRLRRYVVDRVAMMGAISHDLRTPLMRLEYKAERADPALREDLLSDIHQMEAMIAGVLAFIRDTGQKTARECLDLTSLVSCAVDERAVTGTETSFDEATPVVLINGDPLAIRRLIDNLIDNAVHYGGMARVALTVVGCEAVVTVSDNGPGLADTELEQVFTPFYRTEEARAHRVDGTGLGLAIARSVARAHGGDVTLRCGEIGLVAEVTLPLAP